MAANEGRMIISMPEIETLESRFRGRLFSVDTLKVRKEDGS